MSCIKDGADDKLFGIKCMSRQLQVGLVGGSAASLLLKALEALSRAALLVPPGAEEVPACLCPALVDCATEAASLTLESLHLPSLLLGCLRGLLIGPLIDTLYLLRVWWGVFVRSCLRSRAPPLFRILS